jgi:hypothetical protein
LYTFAEHPTSFHLCEVVCHLANMTDRPTYQRTPSTNLAKTPAYRPHEGKFGIVTGGSRGVPRFSELCNLLLTSFKVLELLYHATSRPKAALYSSSTHPTRPPSPQKNFAGSLAQHILSYAYRFKQTSRNPPEPYLTSLPQQRTSSHILARGSFRSTS